MTHHKPHRPSLRHIVLAGVCVLPLTSEAWTTQAWAAPLQGEAFQRAIAAYAAIGRNDLAAAEREARAAVAAQPDSADAARLLMDVLSRQGKRDAAIVAANDAVARGAADADLYAARGYLHQAAQNVAAAAADFTKVLGDPAFAADKQRGVRLSLADAAAAQGKH
ncbi:MAG: hypothetical protein K2P94_11680, partial [Rhodospirillaceae bacterium]|nr:hypothetical protein [Rhodospirillaceae bacterium]